MQSVSEIQKESFYAEGNILAKCINIGCDKDVAVRNWGNWSFKSECSPCMGARKKGIVRAGVTFHKKDFCQNYNGFLEFYCPVDPELWENSISHGSLELDHMDGDHDNNKPENVVTLCAICHNIKGAKDNDFSSRKSSGRRFDK